MLGIICGNGRGAGGWRTCHQTFVGLVIVICAVTIAVMRHRVAVVMRPCGNRPQTERTKEKCAKDGEYSNAKH